MRKCREVCACVSGPITSGVFEFRDRHKDLSVSAPELPRMHGMLVWLWNHWKMLEATALWFYAFSLRTTRLGYSWFRLKREAAIAVIVLNGAMMWNVGRGLVLGWLLYWWLLACSRGKTWHELVILERIVLIRKTKLVGYIHIYCTPAPCRAITYTAVRLAFLHNWLSNCFSICTSLWMKDS